MRRIALLAALALAACGTNPVMAPTLAPTTAKATQANGPCVLTQRITATTADRMTVTIAPKAYYTICPSDSIIKAMGWTKVP